MCFRFQHSSSLRLSPSSSSSSTPGSMLKVNPEERLSITELVNQLQEIAAARNVNSKSPITEVGVCVHDCMQAVLCMENKTLQHLQKLHDRKTSSLSMSSPAARSFVAKGGLYSV